MKLNILVYFFYIKHLEHVNFKLFLSQSDISSLNNVQLC